MSRPAAGNAKQGRLTKNLKNRPQRSSTAMPKAVQSAVALGKRWRGGGGSHNAFVPPEDWHEPTSGEGYRIVTQEAGRGYRHVVSPAEVRDRLAELPQSFLAPLDVVQLSRMTRKKQAFPCYGMQWGSAIYLYPLEEELIEYFDRPPRPAEYNETRAFGGRWVHEAGLQWKLIWTPRTIRDFYLNNVLIHELGHVLDERNSSHRDRERFADWFAIEHGLRRRGQTRSPKSRRRRRKQR